MKNEITNIRTSDRAIDLLSRAIAAGKLRPFVVNDGIVEMAVFPLRNHADPDGHQHYIANIRIMGFGDATRSSAAFSVMNPKNADDVARAAFVAWTGEDVVPRVGDTGLNYPEPENARCLAAVLEGDIHLMGTGY